MDGGTKRELPQSQVRTPGRTPNITTTYQSEPGLATEFRRAVEALHLDGSARADGTARRSVVVTSAVTGEGKTTTAAFLALTTAIYFGRKTLVVDGDLRRPSLDLNFGHDPAPGFSDAILDGTPLERLFLDTDIARLKVVTAGTKREVPDRVLNTEKLKGFVDEALFHFDTVVFDAPPAVPVTDPILLGRATDGLVVVAKVGSTPREVARRAVELIRQSGNELLGVVVNNDRRVLPYYYNQNYYGYGYHSNSR